MNFNKKSEKSNRPETEAYLNVALPTASGNKSVPSTIPLHSGTVLGRDLIALQKAAPEGKTAQITLIGTVKILENVDEAAPLEIATVEYV